MVAAAGKGVVIAILEGYSPLCYDGDITEKTIKEYINKSGNKIYKAKLCVALPCKYYLGKERQCAETTSH